MARVEIARELSTTIWHMLTKREPFAPGRPHVIPLVAWRPSTEMGRRSIRSNLVLTNEEAIER